MEDMDAIKRKIAALLAKAEGTDNEFEAEAFMSKVNELLEKYQIQMHELNTSDPMGHQDGETNVYAAIAWAKMMLGLAARYFGARIVWTGKEAEWYYDKKGNLKSRKKKGVGHNHHPYTIFGPQSARMTAELMFPYLISQVRRQGKSYARVHGIPDAIGAREVGNAFCIRLSKLVANQQAHRDELVKNALVPVDMTQSYIDVFYADSPLTKGKSRKLKYGQEAADYADKISLSAQTTHDRRKMIA